MGFLIILFLPFPFLSLQSPPLPFLLSSHCLMYPGCVYECQDKPTTNIFLRCSHAVRKRNKTYHTRVWNKPGSTQGYFWVFWFGPVLGNTWFIAERTINISLSLCLTLFSYKISQPALVGRKPQILRNWCWRKTIQSNLAWNAFLALTISMDGWACPVEGNHHLVKLKNTFYFSNSTPGHTS